MNKRDEIISMARRAGVIEPLGHTDPWVWGEDALERFADLVAAAEREACALVCDDAIKTIWEFHPEAEKQAGRNVCTNLADAIRSRGAP